MKSAVVTGASSGIGAAVCRRLLAAGWQVYGIGRDFSKQPKLCASANFFCEVCDLREYSETERTARSIIKKVKASLADKEDGNEGIELLVNCAGVGYFGPHEQLAPKMFHEMVTVNLEAPMILTGSFLRDMKKRGGTIVNVSSVTAKKSNAHGCAYGATKAGLTSLGESLFDEARKYGVRVMNIHPDMTASAFYRNADFCQGEEEDTFLEAEEVADCVMDILAVRKGAVVTDFTIRPQRHRIRRKTSTENMSREREERK